MESTSTNISNNTLYSLQNVENYKTTLNHSIKDILNKQKILIIDYIKLVTEKIHIKNDIHHRYIIIRGLDTVSHVFNNILIYTKNLDLAFYHGQKAFYFYVEFIEQITDDTHTFLQLNSRDASMFVYKKTIYDINHEHRQKFSTENIKPMEEIFDLLNIQTNINKALLCFFLNKYVNVNENNNENKSPVPYLNSIIIKIEKIVERILHYKMHKLSHDTLLIFIEEISVETNSEKYIELIELFLKKLHKLKIEHINVKEKIYSSVFSDKLKEQPEKVISWLIDN